ncbi:MAG: cellulase family glycosylhydrolase [Oscillospiraceae bacterium]|nr:cellulase family glycosylhydrolase [Oscillospiraceae bacterium]
MLKEMGIQRGVNLGGWFSQCDYSTERLDSFITEPDFKQIAAWGFDHVRIPFDYNIVQNADGSLIEDGFERLAAALALCEKYGLKAVLDLHKTQGFSFDAGEHEAGFFESERYQALFYSLWEEAARRFGGMQDRVAFELLNEVTEAKYLPAWKRISAEVIRRIRAYAPETVILLGSYHHNSARTLPELDAPWDNRVVYNFHCYEPIEFTHQGAYWMPELHHKTGLTFAASGADEQFFEELFAPAIEKAACEGAELYCGEYGVIDVVPPEEALPWYQAINAVFKRHGIPHCLWSYKEMDFGLADKRMDAVRARLLNDL